jgi:hypothetical protein
LKKLKRQLDAILRPYTLMKTNQIQFPVQTMLENIPTLIRKKRKNLLQEIEEEEMIQAIWSLEKDKAPGPDGFSIHFYRTFWNIVRSNLKRMLNHTLRKKKVGGGTNSTFLALIPKEINPSSFSRFHPISLCNSTYKILTKIIANRLKQIIGRIISNNQGGFIQKRQIVDNIILVQEAIHSSKARKEKCMIIKMDMANAFDRVRHSFLFEVMRKFGFS